MCSTGTSTWDFFCGSFGTRLCVVSFMAGGVCQRAAHEAGLADEH